MDDGGDASDVPEVDVDRWKTVADLFTAIAHPVRVAILESLVADEERPLTEVADAFDYSRSAIQKHVETLEKAEAVYRPEEGSRTYALTPFGQYLALLLMRDGAVLHAAMLQVKDAEEDAKEEFADVPLGEKAMEKAITERKWDMVGDDLEEELAELFPSLEDIDG